MGGYSGYLQGATAAGHGWQGRGETASEQAAIYGLEYLEDKSERPGTESRPLGMDAAEDEAVKCGKGYVSMGRQL